MDAAKDSDGDGAPNSLDTNSDNGGIDDNTEAQFDQSYIAPSGIDSDGNGLDDAYESAPGAGEGLNPADTDNNGIADHLETDGAGNDLPPLVVNPAVTGDANGTPGTAISGSGVPGATIVLSAGGSDLGTTPATITVANDGSWSAVLDTPLADNTDVTATQSAIPNLAGVPSVTTQTMVLDFDSDGVRDSVDIDDDNDGILDAIESVTGPTSDVDGDGAINALDTDSNNGGIADNIEAQNNQPYVAPSNVDSDGDGLDDAYDQDLNGAAGSVGLTPADSDGDGVSDVYQGAPGSDVIPVAINLLVTGSETLISGTGIPGATITLDIPIMDDNGNAITEVTVDENGDWEAIPSTPLADNTDITVTQTINAPHPHAGDQITATETLALDFDGDGARNTVDIDDDNDGIIDDLDNGIITDTVGRSFNNNNNPSLNGPSESPSLTFIATSAGTYTFTQTLSDLTPAASQTYGHNAGINLRDSNGDIVGAMTGTPATTTNLTSTYTVSGLTPGAEYTLGFWTGGGYEANSRDVVIEPPADIDGDGAINSLDIDSDNGGISDILENGLNWLRPGILQQQIQLGR